jgi:hypothetical protein
LSFLWWLRTAALCFLPLIPMILSIQMRNLISNHQRIGPIDSDPKVDDGKTADQLIDEANFLLADERLLDARTKLLRALQKEPKNYNAHFIVGGILSCACRAFSLGTEVYFYEVSSFSTKKMAPHPIVTINLKMITHAFYTYWPKPV